MKRYIAEYASNINHYLDSGIVGIVKTKQEAEHMANAAASEKFREMEAEGNYDNLEFVNNGIYTNDPYTDEMICLYIVTVHEVEIPE